MSNAHDRRAPGTARIPFEAMVEVGGALGPSFEAQALNLSEEGMSLRTAYLPEVGQPVMCRFDAGPNGAIVAAGEVLWKDDLGEGGEFGIRFTNLDGESAAALHRLLGMSHEGAPMEAGQKVRLHIEGLASPMRARIRDQKAAGVTAYSELGFLQMGKPLDLEDAASGHRRPATIDRVEIAIDEASRIPQLVVSLRYDDAAGHAALAAERLPMDTHAPVEMPAEGAHADVIDDEELEAPPMSVQRKELAAPERALAADHDHDDTPGDFKTKLSANAKKVGPAIVAWANRAKTTASIALARARRKSTPDDVEIPIRRTTAPAPGGGLHTAGRKVVRGSVAEEPEVQGTVKRRFPISPKKAAIIGSVLIASILVFFALRKPSAPTQLAAVPPADSAIPAAALPEPTPTAKPVSPPSDPLAAAAAMNAKPGRATPFTNGPVGSHPTVLKIKMDGPVNGIQGAPQPTGFTIVIPNRKSIEPTAALADKDGRIAAVQVSNEPTGAELSVSFKDGVPNYLVRAHGDTLELVLAKGSAHGEKSEAHAKKKHGAKKH